MAVGQNAIGHQRRHGCATKASAIPNSPSATTISNHSVIVSNDITLISHRHCLPVRLSVGGCSFQFGRTSMSRLPHLLHFMRGRNDGTVVSAG
jgi:hypothetical protein